MKLRIFSFSLVLVSLLLLVAVLTTTTQIQAHAQSAGTTTPTSIPGANFSGTPLAGSTPLTVQFTALNPSVLSSCTWTFGDGTSQTLTPPTGQTFSLCPSVSHVYTTTGFFTVSLRVTKSTNGFSNTVTKPNYIQVTNPGEFTATPTRTSIPCGAVIVVTSTLTPTMTATPTRTATATATTCSPIYITATPGAPGPTATFTPTYDITVSGYVHNAVLDMLVPISGATVRAGLNMGRVITATTAADGSYSMLLPGAYVAGYGANFTVSAPGYQTHTASYTEASLRANPVIYFVLAPNAQPTVTPTPTVPVYMSGHVRLGSSTGPGLANVNVCYYLAAYTFDCANHTVLTDQNGYYQMNICTPAQENVTIQASLPGYTFSPASYYQIWYGGCMSGSTYDFVATTGTGTPTAATPTRTPTRTATGPTPTRTPTSLITATRTLTRTPTATLLIPDPTPTQTLGCSPVTSAITAPFTFDGAGAFCWQSSNLGSYINSWNTTSITINGVNITNLYVSASSYPAKVGGYWYVGYNSAVAWGHFEAK